MQVKIGGTTYQVLDCEDLRDETYNRLDGRFTGGQTTIQLSAALSTQGRYAILWHEIVHGILIHAGMDEIVDEERLVSALGYGIVQVLRDNPDLIALLHEVQPV